MPQHGIFRGALVLAMMSVCAGCAGSSSPRPTSSRHDSPRCAAPTDVLAGVYHPSRLQVLAACRTVSGTVTAVSHEQDGDLHIGLDTRGAMTNAVNSSKLRGNLLVEFMPRDGGHLRAPRVGDRVRLTGAWVLDTNHGWEELHPVWSERLDGITDRSGPQFGGSSAGVGSSEASAECATNTGAGCRGYGR